MNVAVLLPFHDTLSLRLLVVMLVVALFCGLFVMLASGGGDRTKTDGTPGSGW